MVDSGYRLLARRTSATTWAGEKGRLPLRTIKACAASSTSSRQVMAPTVGPAGRARLPATRCFVGANIAETTLTSSRACRRATSWRTPCGSRWPSLPDLGHAVGHSGRPRPRTSHRRDPAAQGLPHARPSRPDRQTQTQTATHLLALSRPRPAGPDPHHRDPGALLHNAPPRPPGPWSAGRRQHKAVLARLQSDTPWVARSSASA